MCEEEYDPDLTVEVTNIPATVDREDLELYFESVKYSGGGPTSSLMYDEETHTATIIYEAKSVADEVLGRTHMLDGGALTVTRYAPLVQLPRTIQVSGFGTLTTQQLEMFFENESKSGGGPIESLDMLDDPTKINISFADEGVAERVIEKGSWTLKKEVLSVERAKGRKPVQQTSASLPASESSHSEQEQTCSMVTQETGMQTSLCSNMKDLNPVLPEAKYQNIYPKLPPITDEEENKIRDGSFMDTSEIATDAARQDSLPAGIERKYDDDEERSYDKYTRDTDLVEIDNIPEDLSKDALLLCLESPEVTGGTKVKDLRIEGSTALVKFLNVKDAHKVAACGQITCLEYPPLIGKLLPKYPENRSVVITGFIASHNSQLAQMYFGNSRSGGGPIEEFLFDPIKLQAVIVYKEEDSAQQILKSEHLELEGIHLSASVPYQTLSGKYGRKIEVSGIPKGRTKAITMLFENEGRSGGGAIASIEEVDERTIIITYEDPNVVDRVLKKQPIEYEGKTLGIRICEGTEKMKMQSSQRATQKDEFKPYTDTIEVSNISEKTSEETIRLFFENKKKSGGGDIKSVDLNAATKSAIIQFEHIEDAERVLGRQGLVLHDCPLRVVGVDCQTATDQSCAIVVTGFDKNTGKELLEMYFENQRKSGGGEVESTFFDPENCKLIVTYKTPDVVARVIQKQPQICGDKRLNVEVMKPDVTALIVRGQVDEKKLLVRGVSLKVSADQLQTYLSAASGQPIEEVRFGLEPGIVMVIFAGTPELSRLKSLCSSKPLLDTMMVIQRVAQADSIQVHVMGELSDPKMALEMYFESKKRSGGGEVKRVFSKDRCFIVTFVEHKVVDDVLNCKPHRLNDVILDVAVYHDCLGVIPPNYDTTSPAAWVPSYFDIKDADPKAIKFLLERQEVQKQFEDQMRKCHADVDWPLQPRGEVHLSCSITPGHPEFARISRDWQDNAQRKFKDLLAQITYQEVSTLQEIWEKAASEVKVICNEFSSQNVMVDFEEEKTRFCIIGATNHVKKLTDAITHVTTKLEDELKRKNTVIEEKITKLQKQKLQLLQKVNYIQEIKKEYENLNVDINTKSNIVILKGYPDEVTQAKLKLYETVKDFQTCDVNLTKDMCAFFKTKDIAAKIEKWIKSKKLNVVWETKETIVKVYSLSNNDITHIAKYLKKLFTSKTIPVDEKSRTILGTPAWTEFVDDINKRNAGKLTISLNEDMSSISVTGEHDVLDAANKTVLKFLNENTICGEHMKLEYGVFRFINLHLKSDLDDICRKYGQDKVKFHPVLNGSNCGLTIEAPNAIVHEIKESVELLLKQIRKENHDIDAPDMPKYFVGDQGHDQLSIFERKYKVAIEFKGASIFPPASFGGGGEAKVNLPSGQTICALQADLTKHRVDAIVNAANEHMAHGAGIAGAIVHSGGNSIQTECSDYIKKHGPLKKGEVYVSSAGSLPCKKVVHTVGPVYEDGRHGEDQHLALAVSEALLAANSARCNTVALPAISSGIFGFPLNRCVKIIVKAVKETLPKTDIKQVDLVDLSTKNVAAFRKALMASSSYEEDVDEDDASEPEVASVMEGVETAEEATEEEYSSGEESKGEEEDGADDEFHPKSLFKNGATRYSLLTPDDVTILLVKGELIKQKVDVIVNSTSKSLDLRHGVISQAILKAAGDSIQDECRQRAPRGITEGDVLATGAGKLPHCKMLLHGAIASYRTPECEKVFRKFIENCLNTADKHKMSSIAFPAIGTGGLGVPHNLAAKWMFDEALEFSQSRATNVKKICFVLYFKDEASLEAFEKERKALIETGQSYKGSSDSSSTSHRGREHRGKYTKARGSSGRTKSKGIELKDISIEVQCGDICEEKTEAIINSTNHSLDLTHGAVAKAIVEKGGRSIEQECRKIGKVNRYGIAVTKGGKLRCESIIHVEAPRSVDDWEEKVFSCLYEAESRGFKSVAFPALGTGSRHADPNRLANNMVAGIKKFIEKKKPQKVQLIRITIFQRDLVDTYKKELDDQISSKRYGHSDRGRSGGRYSSSDDDEDDDRSKRDVRPKQHYQGRNKTSSMLRPAASTEKYPRLGLRHPHAFTLTFTIYGQDDSSFKDVISRIDGICNRETKEKVLDSKEDQALIGKLYPAQRSKIEALQKKYHARIKIHNNIIRVQCNVHIQDEVLTQIQKVLRHVGDEVKAAQHARMIAKQVQWEYKDQSGFKPYPSKINLIIEEAHQNKQKYAEWRDKSGKSMRVYFDKHIETVAYDRTSSREVRRQLQEVAGSGDSIHPPNHWTPMSDKDTHKRVQLTNKDPEYQRVSAAFMQTIGSTATVIKIERIQNLRIWQQYHAHKNYLDKANPPGTQNERLLWHGTSSDTVEQIVAQGMNRSFCGKNGTAYGRGVYFAPQAATSHGYARPDSMGNKSMFYCKVLTGEYCPGNSSMDFPPPKPNNPTVRYDSVTNGSSNPGMFVTFHDAAQYPEYLVTFK